MRRGQDRFFRLGQHNVNWGVVLWRQAGNDGMLPH